MRGIADVAISSLASVLPKLRSVETIGEWNIAAAQLIWLESFAAVGGPLESFLQQFVLSFDCFAFFTYFRCIEGMVTLIDALQFMIHAL